MEFFVNELSLHGQYSDLAAFLAVIKEVLQCRDFAQQQNHPLYCLRNITQRPVIADISFKEAVRRINNQGITRIITSWLDKHGPFWDDTRLHDGSLWFEYESGQIATDSSLGEVAFRQTKNQRVATLSFQPSKFTYSPIEIIWRRSSPEDDLKIEIRNCWETSAFKQQCLINRSPVASWTELITRSKADFEQLTFLDCVFDALDGQPFSLTIADRVAELLSILNKLKQCFDDRGVMTSEGHTLMQNFFQGDRALFTDESESNKQRFRKELTFLDQDGDQIFCPYHGKISYRVFRIHFSWPIRHDEKVYIAYIGPKITKS